MKKFVRTAPVALVAFVLAVAAAAPAAAAQPAHTKMFFPSGTRSYEPGEFCAFAVTRDRPSGFRVLVTDYSDGSEALIGLSVTQTYTNPATGKSFVAQVDGHELDLYDTYPIVRGTIQGRFVWQSLPGDAAPGGVIDHLTEFYITGSLSYVANFDTGATSQFLLKGTATDICAALS